MNPKVYLAHAPGAQGDKNLHKNEAGMNFRFGHRGILQEKAVLHRVSNKPNSPLPSILVSFFYLKAFLTDRSKYHIRDWVLDSGAFSAFSTGKPIDLTEYIEAAKELLATDDKLTEVFALDVIGDWRASLANTERMWAAGIKAIPCWHAGEPEDVLKGLARDYDKIAIGGVARQRSAAKMHVAKQVFARVWPKKIHGFGYGSEAQILGLPWHSVDATNWELGPCRFGQWQKYGKMSVRGSDQCLQSQIDYYLDLEQKARAKWAKEMKQFDEPSNIRLAVQPTSMRGVATFKHKTKTKSNEQ